MNNSPSTDIPALTGGPVSSSRDRILVVSADETSAPHAEALRLRLNEAARDTQGVVVHMPPTMTNEDKQRLAATLAASNLTKPVVLTPDGTPDHLNKLADDLAAGVLPDGYEHLVPEAPHHEVLNSASASEMDALMAAMEVANRAGAGKTWTMRNPRGIGKAVNLGRLFAANAAAHMLGGAALSNAYGTATTPARCAFGGWFEANPWTSRGVPRTAEPPQSETVCKAYQFEAEKRRVRRMLNKARSCCRKGYVCMVAECNRTATHYFRDLDGLMDFYCCPACAQTFAQEVAKADG
jgi:hypothetical protein